MKRARKVVYPIKHWSYSSLMSYLRNPLAWHKRYVQGVYDMPSTPSGVVGRACHVAMQHYYAGLGKEAGLDLGLEYLRTVADFEIDFGAAKTKKAIKEKRLAMEHDVVQAVGFYLERPPKYKKILGIEVMALANVPGVPLPIKAISDLVVESKVDPHGVDIIDHKFVDSFSGMGAEKPLFVLQALFNYYTVGHEYQRPVKRFILQECKKRRNKDGSPQMRRYIIDFEDIKDDFIVFSRLLSDASALIANQKTFLPNPSDMFEGRNSFDIYRLGLVEPETSEEALSQ